MLTDNEPEPDLPWIALAVLILVMLAVQLVVFLLGSSP